MVVGRILKQIAWVCGFVSLWTKFREKKSFQELKLEAEDNSFSSEGGKIILSIVGIIMLTGVLIAFFMTIYVTMRNCNK